MYVGTSAVKFQILGCSRELQILKYQPSIQNSCLTWIYLEFKLVFSSVIW